MSGSREDGAARTFAGAAPGMPRAAAVCGLGAVLFAFVITVIGGAARPGYSHVSQFISELGESGAANGAVVSVAGFVPTGILVLLFLVLALPSFPPSRLSLAGAISFGAVGIAYVVSAIARCDAGCPGTGSLSQSVHNTFGALEYVGAFTGLLLWRSAFRGSSAWQPLASLSAVCAALVGIGFAAVLVPSLASIRGASQRVAESGVFLWVAAVSIVLLRPPPGTGRSSRIPPARVTV